MSRQTLLSSLALSAVISFLVAVEYPRDVQAAGPTLVDNNLQVTPVAIGFNQPTSFAFTVRTMCWSSRRHLAASSEPRATR